MKIQVSEWRDAIKINFEQKLFSFLKARGLLMHEFFKIPLNEYCRKVSETPEASSWNEVGGVKIFIEKLVNFKFYGFIA